MDFEQSFYNDVAEYLNKGRPESLRFSVLDILEKRDAFGVCVEILTSLGKMYYDGDLASLTRATYVKD